MNLKTHYSFKDNCHAKLNEVRKLYHTGVTQEQAQEAYDELNELIMYCPADIIGLVESQIHEFEKRMKLLSIELKIIGVQNNG